MPSFPKRGSTPGLRACPVNVPGCASSRFLLTSPRATCGKAKGRQTHLSPGRGYAMCQILGGLLREPKLLDLGSAMTGHRAALCHGPPGLCSKWKEKSLCGMMQRCHTPRLVLISQLCFLEQPPLPILWSPWVLRLSSAIV